MATKPKAPPPIVTPTESDPKPYPEVKTAAYPDNWDAQGPIASFTSATPAAKPITNTSITTSADTQSPVQSQNIPMPIGYQAPVKNGLQSTQADKPENYLSPGARQMLGYGNAAFGGWTAGGQVAPAADSGDAMLQVAGAGIGGAATGAAYGALGGPGGALIGAGVGGLVGLVSGGINAFVGTHAARTERRRQDKIRADIMAKEEARYQQDRADQQQYFNTNRADTLEQTRYNRRMDALHATLKAQEAARAALNDTISQDVSFKNLLTSEVR